MEPPVYLFFPSFLEEMGLKNDKCSDCLNANFPTPPSLSLGNQIHDTLKIIPNHSFPHYTLRLHLPDTPSSSARTSAPSSPSPAAAGCDSTPPPDWAPAAAAASPHPPHLPERERRARPSPTHPTLPHCFPTRWLCPRVGGGRWWGLGRRCGTRRRSRSRSRRNGGGRRL